MNPTAIMFEEMRAEAAEAPDLLVALRQRLRKLEAELPKKMDALIAEVQQARVDLAQAVRKVKRAEEKESRG